MKRSVTYLLAATAMAHLGSCGSESFELLTDRAYCFGIADTALEVDLEQCSDHSRIRYLDADGKLHKFTPHTADTFSEVGSVAGAELTADFFEARLRGTNGTYKLESEDYADDGTVWMVAGNGQTAQRINALYGAISTFDPNEAMPSETIPYLNEPLCQNTVNYRNNTARGGYDLCAGDRIVTIFSSGGKVVELFLNSLDDEEGISWRANDDWLAVNGVARPDRFAEYEWFEDSEGFPATQRLREQRQYRLGSGQAFDPSVIESMVAFPKYDGDDRDRVLDVYRSVIFPELRRRQLVLDHFPELDR